MKQQVSSSMCFVCGLDNPVGLRVVFKEDDRRVWAEFTPRQEYEGWPGFLHGGLVCVLLQEAMARAFFIEQEICWMVPTKMDVQYLDLAPLEQPLTLVGEITRMGSRAIEALGEMRLSDGSVAARAKGVFVKGPHRS